MLRGLSLSENLLTDVKYIKRVNYEIVIHVLYFLTSATMNERNNDESKFQM